MSRDATVTLTLTPHELDVLHYFQALGGAFQYADSAAKVMDLLKHTHDSTFPEWWDEAEGTLAAKLLAVLDVPAAEIARLREMHAKAWERGDDEAKS